MIDFLSPTPRTVKDQMVAMLDLYTRPPEERVPPPLAWRAWVALHFTDYTRSPFGDRHIAFWEWVAGLRRNTKPRARVEVWPRGGAKSTTVELACAWLGSHPEPQRRFVLYVSETQAQADKHVRAIAAMLETVGIDRAVNHFGSSKGWTRTEIRAANGFNVVAFGLDSGMRGVKLEDVRPDLIVMDDIDGRHDSERTTEKKIETITETVLPAGSVDAAVVVIQNKIHKDSIVSQLADGTADFLYDRHVATVEPAVRGLEYVQEKQPDGTIRFKITAGEPTWAGQDLATCELQLNEWGTAAFLREAQHEVDQGEHGLWTMDRDIVPHRVAGSRAEIPGRVAWRGLTIGVDPNAGEGGDEAGIVIAGAAYQKYNPNLGQFEWCPDLRGYVLADWTVAGGPATWAAQVVRAWHHFRVLAPGRIKVVAEKNHGGDMVAITIGTVPGAPPVELVSASLGKATRAEPVQVLAEQGLIHHAGTFRDLESELTSWTPGDPSPNRLDACFVAGTEVLTDRGQIPIEDVRVGDLALTRVGWKPVTNCGMTNPNADLITVEFSDGRRLTGTPEHPVWTENRGFVALDTLVWTDILVTDNQHTGGPSWTARKTSSSSTASPLSGTPMPRPSRLAGITTPTSAASALRAWVSSIRRSGRPLMGRSLRATTSTIGTAIRSTMTSRISNALPRLNTPLATLPSSMMPGSNMPTASGPWPLSGTGARRGEHGIGSTGNGPGRDATRSNWTVLSAERPTRPEAPAAIVDSAHADASPATTNETGPITRTGLAPSADRPSTSSDPSSNRPAPVHVVGKYADGSGPVYNLEVADQPEYFANGVLVHNCVWAFTDLLLDGQQGLEGLKRYYDRQLGRSR